MINGGIFKLGQSHKTRLALTPSFLTHPFKRYSTSNTTSVPRILVINFNNFYWQFYCGKALVS